VKENVPKGISYYSNGINFFKENPCICDVVFDCTDASSAIENYSVFLSQGITVIDMTPSKIGQMCVPNINCGCLNEVKNVNMITCGGQVSIPLLKYITSKCEIHYAEVVTQISSESAGMATRINVDKYIETTEKAILSLTSVQKCKVILNINPKPDTIMQTTILMKAGSGIFEDFDNFISLMKSYVPRYEVEKIPSYCNGILTTSVKVYGSGDHLSIYAGNLDVINCAAIEILKKLTWNKTLNTNIYQNILDI
jgi:acetaldehyde dehydrogenase